MGRGRGRGRLRLKPTLTLALLTLTLTLTQAGAEASCELCVLPPLEADDPLAPPKNGTLMRIGGFEWYAS